MFEAFKKIEYSGVEGDIVQIPNRQRGTEVSNRTCQLIDATCGPDGWNIDKNGYLPVNYLGLHPVKDASEYSYTAGYTATETGSGSYSIKEETEYHADWFTLKIFVGCDESVAEDKNSNVNTYLRAISWAPRSLGFWILSLILVPCIIGIPLLVGCVYRLVCKFIAKNCIRKAKESFKKNHKIIVF